MSKPFAYNQKGFVLIEHLIALFIAVILTATATHILQVIASYQVETHVLSQHEVQTLATRIQNEARWATSLSAHGQELRLHFDDSTVSFVMRNGRLLRQIDGLGGEVALYLAEDFRVVLLNNYSATLQFASISGEIFSVYISTFRRGDWDEIR